MARNVIIMGAAGRDFHNFNVFFKDNKSYCVKAFTAAQIPDIDGRQYPKELSGELYPDGIPIYSEDKLSSLIKELEIHDCVFSYSDVSYKHVMKIGAEVEAAGANFILLGPNETMIKARKPVIAVGAVRTGCGKSQTARKIIEILNNKDIKVVAIRHPMPYGNLKNQKVQRFKTLSDLEKYNCTIEEIEEYEPHIASGNIIYAGIDYGEILKNAENDPDGCDIILWDGGNNDFPFYKPDLMITVSDPHRAGDELSYYPGEITLRIADAVIINKVDSSEPEKIQILRGNISKVNPDAVVIDAASPVYADDPDIIADKKVLVIEDGPTLTHGGMKFGAGTVAANKYSAKLIVDPRPFTVGKISDVFKSYPEIGSVLPAMGYGDQQLKDLETTINKTDCDSVIIATPIDLKRLININKPSTRIFYDLQEIGKPDLEFVLAGFLEKNQHRIIYL